MFNFLFKIHPFISKFKSKKLVKNKKFFFNFNFFDFFFKNSLFFTNFFKYEFFNYFFFKKFL